MAPADTAAGLSRRRLLAAGAGLGTALTAGCVRRARSLVNRQQPEPISLTVKTPPADEDRAATRIGRQLATHLGAVGIDAEVVLMAEDELYRDVLINHDFDLFVGRLPEQVDPDALRPLLHSVFNGEPGWQNPYGFTDLTVDDLLDAQRRRAGADRRAVIYDLQREIARLQPFSPVCVPDEIRAVRDDRFTNWTAFDLSSPLGYLGLRRTPEAPDADPRRLRVTITDDRVTKNFNPIAVEFRNRGIFTGLLYDPIARRYDGRLHPWLASDWTWEPAGPRTAATIRLREGLRWHDDSPLGADDVAFTYRFLADTALGSAEGPVPAPRFRGRVSLVDAVDGVDERTLRFDFGATDPEVAARALTVPILPRHEWAPQATEANLVGLDLFEGVTEALVWANPEPVGSGPLAFRQSIAEESLILERAETHFLHREEPPPLADRFDGGVAFDELVARVVPSDESGVEVVAADEADATADTLDPGVVPRIGRSRPLQLLVARSQSVYHVGFNARRAPLGNPRFRRAIAGLLDQRSTVDTVFDGYAAPTATPLAEAAWTPSDLRWRGSDPEVPFYGTDGDLDVTDAREAFRGAGYQYNEAGQLVGQ